MELVIALAALTGWFFCSRWLFRYWVRTDRFIVPDISCSHGYDLIHEHDPCRGSHLMSHSWVACLAMMASLFMPIVLPAALVYAGITHNPPKSLAELEKEIEALEKENDRLQRKADREY
jgi:hypothetical protein